MTRSLSCGRRPPLANSSNSPISAPCLAHHVGKQLESERTGAFDRGTAMLGGEGRCQYLVILLDRLNVREREGETIDKWWITQFCL